MLNKYFIKHLLIILITSLFLSCNTTTNSKNIDIVLETSEYPVMLRYSKKHKLIWRVDFPINASLKNNSFLRKNLHNVNYNYDDGMEYHSNIHYGNNTFVRVFKKVDKQLKRIKTDKYLYYNEQNKMILYPHIRLDSTKKKQLLYKRYLDTIVKNNLDSLAIGSVKELKIKHPELIQFFNKGALYFEFRQNNSVRTDDIHNLISL